MEVYFKDRIDVKRLLEDEEEEDEVADMLMEKGKVGKSDIF